LKLQSCLYIAIAVYIYRAMMLCGGIMKAALSKRRYCTILYATETGISEGYANKLQRIFGQAFHVEVNLMLFIIFFV